MNKKVLLTIVLFQPEIPPNTGNIIRLCANTGCDLHLIEPLGFPLEDSKLKRAGLDYHEYANITIHKDWISCKNYLKDRRFFLVETCANQYYNTVNFNFNDVLIFGSETKGLPKNILDEFTDDKIIRIPMQENQRSLNLSNSVAIVIYEAWRQLSFINGV